MYKNINTYGKKAAPMDSAIKARAAVFMSDDEYIKKPEGKKVTRKITKN